MDNQELQNDENGFKTLHSRRKYIIEAFILFAAFFLTSAINFNTSPEPVNYNNIFFHLIFYSHALPKLVLVMYFVKYKNKEPLSALGIKKLQVPDFLRAVLLLMAMFTVLFIIVGPIFSFIPESHLEDVPDVSFSFSFVAFFFLITTCLLTGYWEEIFFRGFLLSRFEKAAIPRVERILISSILFAVCHVYNSWFGLINAFIFGILLGFVWDHFRRIHIVAIAHALFNFILIITSQTMSDELQMILYPIP